LKPFINKSNDGRPNIVSVSIVFGALSVSVNGSDLFPLASNVHTFFSRSLFLTEQQQQTEEEGEEQQQPLISFQFISILFAIVVAFSLPQVSFCFVVVCTMYICMYVWFFHRCCNCFIVAGTFSLLFEVNLSYNDLIA